MNVVRTEIILSPRIKEKRLTSCYSKNIVHVAEHTHFIRKPGSVYPSLVITKEGGRNNLYDMHPVFMVSLPDPQFQNPQNRLAVPAVLSFRIEQIHHEFERCLSN